MAEPTVQVPVSLLKGLRDALADHDDPHCEVDNYASDQAHISHVDALLSQPSSTAEPMQTCGVCGRKYPESDTRDTCPVCCPGFGEYTAEPPRIEDMAPGTTFWARTRYGALSGTDRFWMVADARGYVIGTSVHYLPGAHIDPSTIRDVTPPKDAA